MLDPLYMCNMIITYVDPVTVFVICHFSMNCGDVVLLNKSYLIPYVSILSKQCYSCIENHKGVEQ